MLQLGISEQCKPIVWPNSPVFHYWWITLTFSVSAVKQNVAKDPYIVFRAIVQTDSIVFKSLFETLEFGISHYGTSQYHA